MTEFFSGFIVMGYAVAALYFVKFARATGDRLFVFFASAFVLLALQRTLITAFTLDSRLELASYMLRLLAFLLILAGIFDKNRDADSDT